MGKIGLNVVLVSRNRQKLEDQAKFIEETCNVLTKVIAVDFTEPDSIYDEIKAVLVNLDIAVLVNNVGLGYEYKNF